MRGESEPGPGEMMGRGVSFWPVLLIFICFFARSLAARSLYWQDLEVTARLDAEGRLHVRERQTMVFSGDWQGGERRFNIRPGQSLRLNAIERLTGDGRRIRLVQGGAGRKDHWIWYRSDTLRWWARSASDPVFDQTPITYVLDYTLSGILYPEGKGYLLNHDFAFPDRSGEIRTFRLHFTLDPSWRNPDGGQTIELSRFNLPPGRSVRVRRLFFHPSGLPAAVAKRQPTPSARSAPAQPAYAPAPSWLRVILPALLWLLLLVKVWKYYRHEQSKGRFRPLVPVDEIDEAWLAEHVFSLSPEVVGAVWDKKTDASEVAAVLARMVLEGKLKSRVEPWTVDVLGLFSFRIPGRYVLHLELLLERDRLSGYERELVDGLFVAGNKTDTKTIREYYRSKRTTFNPVTRISVPLSGLVEGLTRPSEEDRVRYWIMTVFLGLGTFFTLLLNFFMHEAERPYELIWGAVLFVLWVAVMISAATVRDSAIRVRAKVIGFIALLAAVTAVHTGLSLYFLHAPFSPLLFIGCGLLMMSIILTGSGAAQTLDSLEGVDLRRRLASARLYLLRELERDAPAIRDQWFPWLVAFGLGPQVDRWFRQFGSSAGISGYGSGVGGGYTFTGGGGQFGGGGASGAWTSAASAMSATASSSGTSGGGAGGGSGGGGGGGF